MGVVGEDVPRWLRALGAGVGLVVAARVVGAAVGSEDGSGGRARRHGRRRRSRSSTPSGAGLLGAGAGRVVQHARRRRGRGLSGRPEVGELDGMGVVGADVGSALGAPGCNGAVAIVVLGVVARPWARGHVGEARRLGVVGGVLAASPSRSAAGLGAGAWLVVELARRRRGRAPEDGST